jgi:predicted CoA-binding protein
MRGTDQEQLQLANASTIAVVGISPRPERPSHYVALYLQEQGYRIIPVNPMLETVLGERCYPDLKSVPERVDMVNIFRRSEHVGPIVDDAIAIGAKYVWMQDGVVDEAAAARAREAGLLVVMDN